MAVAGGTRITTRSLAAAAYTYMALIGALVLPTLLIHALAKDEIVLRLRHDYKWREEGVGILSIVGVDTGGGPVKLNGEDGVQVAEVHDNLDQHGVTVAGSEKVR